jgi:hypothetical protein
LNIPQEIINFIRIDCQNKIKFFKLLMDEYNPLVILETFLKIDLYHLYLIIFYLIHFLISYQTFE